MRELTELEVSQISGGTDSGDIAMGVGTAWASAVFGAGIGTLFGPGIGTLIGAGVGFTLGSLGAVGYTLATGDIEADPSDSGQ
jgi:hypothetical protein